MRFATVEASLNAPINGLEEFISAAGLDLLQLRYRRPLTLPCGNRSATSPEVHYPSFNEAFSTHLKQVAKTLYLEPGLRIFADAGWGNAYGCVEASAKVLTEAGCDELLVSAVRGSNLLPMLDQLRFGGAEFTHRVTAAPFDTEGNNVLAADLQLGAGPIQVALAEGARVVVAGNCDLSSAVAAAAVHRFNWNWDDYQKLAGAAAAATLAEHLPHRFSLQSPQSIAAIPTSVDADGNVTISLEANRLPDIADRPTLRAADVVCSFTAAAASPLSPGTAALKGFQGSEPDDNWQLDLTYATGYEAASLLQFSNLQLAEQFLETLQTLGVSETARLGELCLVLRYRTQTFEECYACCLMIEQAVAQLGPDAGWLSGPPSPVARCERWPTSLPKDQVDIAVDTRPANEWY
ncbi:acyclic terpene utilization AtuA family protein [Adhaeretor mobilis]|uniref:Acyclic terpene utilisation N-terminal domain-containing protein n=1 Tax=Adhaeretor mobilis TaxID=1930276 RepID=A0A517MTE0_9BACT|nr:acyclic terpene utilization AtuA family protein [Adhaeretor mobilis]QDS98122.1 hypothetical protein HG15A2_13940 [Adhaeretor mobilis]